MAGERKGGIIGDQGSGVRGKNEHRTSNDQRRILNKVFCQFINWRSEAVSSFDVQCWMFDVGRSSFSRLNHSFNYLAGIIYYGFEKKSSCTFKRGN